METKKAIAAFAALAQETRLRIFRLLVRRGPEGLPAGKIAERLAIPANTLSFHLSHLARAGLIESRRAGRIVFYAMSERGIRGLTGYLIKDCCRDSPRLCSPAAPAEPCCPPPAAPARKSAARSARRPSASPADGR
jgi:DNA-binding transcriptional ArsR family regulator